MQHKVPVHIDEPQQLLWFSMADFIPVTIGLVFGVILEKVLLCMAVGLVIAKIYGRFKDVRPDGFIIHRLYWSGLMPEEGRVWVNPFRRFWIG